jgi:peptidoglycan/LPS O-acetylase OafA/YrhL
MGLNDSTSASNGTSVPTRHLLFIDGIRGLAALFVTTHHMWLQLWPQAYGMLPSGLMLATTGWLGYGHFGVTVFIVLSGFSLAFSAAQRDQFTQVNRKDFYIRRARRILPPYYFALLVSCLLAAFFVGKPTGTHWDVALPVTTLGVLSHLFMMQDVFYISQINHTFWSIAFEWKLYFLFPFLLVACSRIGPLIVAASCTALGYVALFLLHGTPYNNFPIHFVGLFAIGAAAAFIVFSRDSRWQKFCQSPFVSWIGVGSVFFVVAASWSHYMRGLFYIDLFVSLATVAALLKMSLGRWRLLKAALAWKPLAFVGSFAYSLYLIHAPLIQCVWQYVVHPLGTSRNMEFFLLVLIGLPFILVCAFLFYLGCERPFLRSRGTERAKTQSPSTSIVAGTTEGASVAS